MTRRVAVVVAAIVVLLPGTVLACPVCFGASDGPMLQGSNMGIFALLVVTLVMLAAFALFFVHLMRRAASVGESADGSMAHEHGAARSR